jgi:hypothetical protein
MANQSQDDRIEFVTITQRAANVWRQRVAIFTGEEKQNKIPRKPGDMLANDYKGQKKITLRQAKNYSTRNSKLRRTCKRPE